MNSGALGIQDIYKSYKKDNKKNSVSFSDFRDILFGYVEFIILKLLSGDTVCLPERMGNLQFVGQKVKPKIDDEGNIKGLSPDWKKTNELWNNCPECKERKELVFHFNEHTQGLRYRMKWSKKRVFIQNKEYYTFRLSVPNKDRFVQSVENGNEYLVEIPKTRYHE